MASKQKIINDPVYGFVTIPSGLIYDLIQEPAFQRLRRIRQLGLTELVYPGALHNRFQHALGSMHLMSLTLDHLRRRGHLIDDAEAEAALIAILFHDVGHSPFSHTLEFSLFGVAHEKLSLQIMDSLNKKYKGALTLAIQIFNGQYHRKFFNQLVASQLDMDRLDYLKRDSYFTGVSEGKIGVDRIIQMLNIHDDELVVEEKGIYSIENFLSARRLMYWQVYLHKVALSADAMLNSLISRVTDLYKRSKQIYVPPALLPFLDKAYLPEDLLKNEDMLSKYLKVDDLDIWFALKKWCDKSEESDEIVQMISKSLIDRKLFQIRISNERPSRAMKDDLVSAVRDKYDISDKKARYLVMAGDISNAAYIARGSTIKIQKKGGSIEDIARAGDLPNIKAMSKIVKKYYICWPKDISL